MPKKILKIEVDKGKSCHWGHDHRRCETRYVGGKRFSIMGQFRWEKLWLADQTSSALRWIALTQV